MSVLAFVRKCLGQYVTAPGGIGGQCVDLLNQYMVDVFARSPYRANAADWRELGISGFRWVDNGPTNYPTMGDIVVWGPFPPLLIGRFGHIALVLVADSMNLVTLDQDWPVGSKVALTLHGYQGVLGWHHLAG